MRKNLSKLTVLAVVYGLALLAVGCGGPKFSRVNYETIYLGQPAGAVEDKLGEPTRREEGTWIYVNDEPWYRAVIEFDDGRVADKHWWWTRP